MDTPISSDLSEAVERFRVTWERSKVSGVSWISEMATLEELVTKYPVRAQEILMQLSQKSAQ